MASGEVFPDALAATPLAIQGDAPLVLTKAGTLSPQTRDYLAELVPETVVVLGGEQRVSDAELTQIETASGARVSRIEGANRYATAAELATDWAAGEPDMVYLASGQMFADALSVGPLAGIADDPVLLTDESILSDGTAAALVAQEITVEESAYLATGEVFPDALAGGVRAGSVGAPLLLTPSARLGLEAADNSVARPRGRDAARRHGCVEADSARRGARLVEPVMQPASSSTD